MSAALIEWDYFKGAAKRIDDLDLPRFAHRIGCGEDEIHAFMDVEASGSGFDSEGRPKILFEPHVFYRNLSGLNRTEAVNRGLAAKSWGTIPYGKSSEQYDRLVRAMAIDETAAIRACSWGLGQILGENHRIIGYPTPQAMVIAFMEDEENHLHGIIEFLIANGIDDDLREHRWQTVARVYNGPQHAKHDYAGRMARAFAKWAKIRDTPWKPEDEVIREIEGELVPIEPAVVSGPVLEAPEPAERPADGADDLLVEAKPAQTGFWAWFRGLFA